MKMHIKKLVSILVCLCVILSVVLITSSAAETSATISFVDLANRVSAGDSQQVWAQNGITVTNNKGASTSNVNPQYYNPVRFYKNSDVIIEFPQMTKIEIDCTGVDSKNKNAWVNSCTGATATLSGNIVTITFDTAVDSFKIQLTDNQARAKAMTIYAAETTPEEPGDVIVDGVITPLLASGTVNGSPKTLDTCVAEHAIRLYTVTTYKAAEIEEMTVAEGCRAFVQFWKEDGSYNAGSGWKTVGTYKIAELSGFAGATYFKVTFDSADGATTPPVDGLKFTLPTTTPEEPDTPVVPEEPEEPEVPETGDPAADSTLTIKDAIALGASKEHNTYTEGKYYIEGEIKQVYNNVYGNMYLVDAEGNQITLYGTYDATGEKRYDAMEVKPVAGDKIKVYGIIGQYNGTAQMKNGWIVEHTLSETPVEPEAPVEIPEADSELTIEDALKVGASLDHNTYTEGKYYITGKITEFYGTGGETYGNFYLVDDAGNKILVYGTFASDGETKYGDMETKPTIGDTVTVYGALGQYNGNAQMKNAWFVEDTDDDNGETPETPVNPEDPETPDEDEIDDEDEIIDDEIIEEEGDAGAGGGGGGAAQPSPETGDAVTAFIIIAMIMMASILAAVVILKNKKVRN